MRHLILGGILLALAPPAAARSLGALDFEPCTLAPDYVTVVVEAQCTTLAVPEDPARPDGRQVELAIAWVPARGDAAPDPVFMLAGGPGQSAKESYPLVAGAFADVVRNRHVILLDQRGTGGSNPLVCRDKDGDSAVTDDPTDASPGAARAFAERCLAQLAEQADPRFYTTTDAVRDLDTVRRAIGAEAINLVGISYGTRVAQQYAMRHPAATRSIVLAGVVPNTLVLGAEHARNLDAALELHFAQCADTPACRERFGRPREVLRTLAAELKAAPRPVAFRHPSTGVLEQGELGYGHLAAVVRLYAYAPQTAAMLPLTLHEALEGRAEPLMAQAEMLVGQISGQIMHGMQLSVLCTEDAPELRARDEDADTVLGTEFVDFSLAQCAVWPAGTRPDDFKQPLATPVPALLVSGALDPVTPPRYGEAVAGHLPNGRHLVLAGQGHNTLGVGCMPKLLAKFLETADAAALDTGCLERLTPTPPFAGFYGWEP
jgi:pimeloyl-ACP methyl ester carboxylesterase